MFLTVPLLVTCLLFSHSVIILFPWCAGTK
jgi:hypothetical protein